jgi:hypothetical protein
MAVHGDQWLVVVYMNQEYDPEEPWEGLFRSQLLVWVGIHSFSFVITHCCMQAYKHIFTSPSSVEKEVKATRSGNVRRCVQYSRNYICPQLIPGQLHFALSSSSVFCRSDTSTDSERFYESVLAFLDNLEKKDDVGDLLNWWNW